MFNWASGYENLYKVCNLFNLKEIENPKRFSYKSLEGYIQNGPQCGLVALAIACEEPNKDFIDNIYEFARKQNFTYNGEIFSSIYMENLARSFLKDKFNVSIFNGELENLETKEHLMSGGLVLVAYDTDRNNCPGSFNGHTAHWALLCGAVETEDNFYVIARHGKSMNVAVWTLKDLSASNMQLNEFSPDRRNSYVKYMIPEGGLNGNCGLKGTAVFLKRV